MSDQSTDEMQQFGWCFDCEGEVDPGYLAVENECPDCGGDWFGTY